MGNWSDAPWENDGAADWFSELFNKTKLAKHVEKTLELDPEENYEEIRAAAAVVLLLCHNFVWPVDDMDRHLELAASRLETLIKLDVYANDAEVIAQMRSEIEALRGRIKVERFQHPKWWHF